MKLVEAATERYQQVALLMNSGGSKEEEISTAQEPQTPDSANCDAGDSLEEDESLIPVPENENVKLFIDTQVIPDSANGDAGDSHEENKSPIPVPGNENVKSSTDTQVMNTPWKIFFPHNVDDSREPTNQSSETRTGVESPASVDSGNSTGHSTNQSTEKEGDVTVNNPTNENTEIDQTNQRAQDGDDVIVDKRKQFRWNVHATEFKPSFV